MNRHPLRGRLPAFYRRLELDFARRKDCVFSKPVRKPPHYADAVELAVAEQQHLEYNQTLHPDSLRFARVLRIRPRGDLRFHVDFLLRVTRHLIVIEQVRERAVVSAAIVLIPLGRDHGS